MFVFQLFGVLAHDYHGKKTDFEGPQCRRWGYIQLQGIYNFFQNPDKSQILTPYLETSEEKMLFLVALKAFKSFNDLVFGSN